MSIKLCLAYKLTGGLRGAMPNSPRRNEAGIKPSLRSRIAPLVLLISQPSHSPWD